MKNKKILYEINKYFLDKDIGETVRKYNVIWMKTALGFWNMDDKIPYYSKNLFNNIKNNKEANMEPEELKVIHPTHGKGTIIKEVGDYYEIEWDEKSFTKESLVLKSSVTSAPTCDDHCCDCNNENDCDCSCGADDGCNICEGKKENIDEYCDCGPNEFCDKCIKKFEDLLEEITISNIYISDKLNKKIDKYEKLTNDLLENIEIETKIQFRDDDGGKNKNVKYGKLTELSPQLEIFKNNNFYKVKKTEIQFKDYDDDDGGKIKNENVKMSHNEIINKLRTLR